MAMKPEFKKVWVEALRSGEFEQGRGRLRNSEGGYCCLGVACVAWSRALLPTIILEDRPDLESQMKVTFEGSSNFITTPSSIDKAVGLEATATNELILMNDEQGKSFAEIADYIEANL